MIPGLFVVPILVAFAATGVVLMLLGILAYGYVYGRLLIWLPAVAVDDRLTFWEAWAVSGGNGFRLLGVVLGVTLAAHRPEPSDPGPCRTAGWR